METCEVYFSNGYSIKVTLSQRAFIELISTEDLLLDNRLLLLEDIEDDPIYINPLQIVSVKASFSEKTEKEAEINKRESQNLKAVKSLSGDIENME